MMISLIHKLSACIALLLLPFRAYAVAARVDVMQVTVYYTEAAAVPVFPWVAGIALAAILPLLIRRVRSAKQK